MASPVELRWSVRATGPSQSSPIPCTTCWQISVCSPPCGPAERSYRTDVIRRTTMNLKVTAAVGHARTELAAFDQALILCGVANFNLIRLSSVIPPGSTIIETTPPLSLESCRWGDRLYV